MIVVGVVVVVICQTTSFLNPTVEPHLNAMNVSPVYVGIAFLLLFLTYTLCAPIIGLLSGKVDNKFAIMALGLFLSSHALLLLGPSSFIPINASLWLSMSSMAFLGLAYAVAFIPTFESILEIAMYD